MMTARPYERANGNDRAEAESARAEADGARAEADGAQAEGAQAEGDGAAGPEAEGNGARAEADGVRAEADGTRAEGGGSRAEGNGVAEAALGSCAVGLDSCTFSLGSVIAVCPLMWPGVGDFELHAVSLLIDFGLCTAGCAVGLGAGSCVVSCSVVGLGPCTISLGSCAVGLGFGLCAVGLGLCAVGLGLCGAVGLCASTVDCAVAFSLGHTVAIDVGWAVTVAVGCAESCIFVTSACAFTIAVPMLTGDCSSAPTFADGCASAAARSALAPTLDAQLGARCPWRIGARLGAR